MPIRRDATKSHGADTAVDSVSVEELFNYGRVKKDAPISHKLLFLLYLPFGLVLLVMRTLLFTLMCLFIIVLPRAIGDVVNVFLLKIFTGLVVFHNHKGRPLADIPHIVAANHVSDFDTFALWITTPRFHTVTSAHLKAIPIMGAVYSALDAIFVAPTPESRDQVKSTIKQRLETTNYPVVIFPEGGLTSGKKGTMMYHKFVFSLDCGIVPCAIRLRDPWPVEHDYLGSSWGKNFFWFMLVPFHIFEITYLPVEIRRDNETPEDFAHRVQVITSQYCGIEATKHSYSQKKELVKKLKEKSA